MATFEPRRTTAYDNIKYYLGTVQSNEAMLRREVEDLRTANIQLQDDNEKLSAELKRVETCNALQVKLCKNECPKPICLNCGSPTKAGCMSPDACTFDATYDELTKMLHEKNSRIDYLENDVRRLSSNWDQASEYSSRVKKKLDDIDAIINPHHK